MPFTIERNDLAHMSVDAIVVAANERLQIDGGVGLAVARAAGLEQMQAACDALGGCPTGSAVVTPAFALDAQHVVHVVGPVWQDGAHNEQAVLRAAYDSALNCAFEAGAQSIALPLISAHTFRFPVRLSFVIAVEAVKAFLENHDCDVRIVLYGRDAMAVGTSLFDDVAEYIDDHYVERQSERLNAGQVAPSAYERGFGSVPLPGATQPEWRQPAESEPAANRQPIESASAANRRAAASAAPESSRDSGASQGWEHPTMSPFFPKASSKQQRLFERFADVVDRVRDNAAERKAREQKEKRARRAAREAGTCVVREDREEESLQGPFLTPEQSDYVHEQRARREGFCPVCREPVPEGALYCMHCGRDLPLALSEYRIDAAEPIVDAASMPPQAFAPSFAATPTSASKPMASATKQAESLSSWLDQLDASFSTTLLALIDARGLTDAQVYKRANMSRQLFSKIRSDATYRPTKKTVLALAIALGLDLGETADLLRRAGFALSHSSKADVIVEYFIVNQNHDIFAINEALYAFDQPLL